MNIAGRQAGKRMRKMKYKKSGWRIMQGIGKSIILLTGILLCVFLTACSGNDSGENATKLEKTEADTFQMENSMDSSSEMPDGEEENMEQEIIAGSFAI